MSKHMSKHMSTRSSILTPRENVCLFIKFEKVTFTLGGPLNDSKESKPRKTHGLSWFPH